MYPNIITQIKTLFSNLASEIANRESAITVLQNDLTALRNDLGNIVYPVGSIYMSMNETDPATLFGGTWERLADGQCLIAGGEDSGYEIGTTGGATTEKAKVSIAPATQSVQSATQSVTVNAHTLTVSQIPSHRHGITTSGSDSSGSYNDVGDSKDRTNYTGYTGGSGSHTHGVTTSAHTHTGDEHNHTLTITESSIMQPYLVVAIWKRTA